MKLAKLISQRIRTLREATGLSQQEIAVKGDLSLSLVAKLEEGKKADPAPARCWPWPMPSVSVPASCSTT